MICGVINMCSQHKLAYFHFAYQLSWEGVMARTAVEYTVSSGCANSTALLCSKSKWGYERHCHVHILIPSETLFEILVITVGMYLKFTTMKNEDTVMAS